MKLSYVLAAACAAIAAAPAAAGNREDPALNAVYEKVAAAKAAASAEGFAETFGKDAVLIDARPGPPMVGAEFHGRIRQMSERIRADGVKVDARYRVERRVVDGDVAIDAGYMRQAMSRPGAPGQVQYAKFLVTFRRGGDGWRIVGDASMPASEEAWNAAAKSEGLKYDT